MLSILSYNAMIYRKLDDGKLVTESESGDFWGVFGGFAPIGKKIASEDEIFPESTHAKLFW